MTEHLLPHSELISFLHQQTRAAKSGSTAVLYITLLRTDRLATITGAIPTSTIQQHIAHRLNGLLRKTDRFAHVDNDLLLILPSLVNCDHSVLAALKIIAELKKPISIGSAQVTLRPYVGIASHPETGHDCDQLLMQADAAALTATDSEQGFHIFQAAAATDSEIHSNLEAELASAIYANELRVEYQPKIDIKTGQCIAAEALVRWTAPWGQEVNPSNLIDAAEHSGLIGPLTLWILNTALRQAASFEKAGVSIGISVNLPAKMLEEEELPQIIQQALDVWNVQPTTLTLEITEGSMIRNIEASVAMLTRLRNIGIGLSIDDFGTGYSALAYLKNLPVQELKIDILFVRNIHSSLGDKQLVRSIIELAHNFNLVTVAEGVEDQQTLDLLRDLGCDIAQGFFYSRTLPEPDFIRWYRNFPS